MAAAVVTAPEHSVGAAEPQVALAAAAAAASGDPAAGLRFLLRRRSTNHPDVDLQGLALAIVKVRGRCPADVSLRVCRLEGSE